MRTPSSSPCQLRLGVVLRCLSLSSYNTSKKTLGLCNKPEGRLCAKERENISHIKRGESQSKRICKRTVEKGVYQILKVASDFTGILCRKER